MLAGLRVRAATRARVRGGTIAAATERGGGARAAVDEDVGASTGLCPRCLDNDNPRRGICNGAQCTLLALVWHDAV